MKNKIKWGILGCARIAKQCIIPAFNGSCFSELHGIASRDQEKAEIWKKEFSFTKTYFSYQDLLDDPQIDAIYIPLPNSMHCEWVIAAAKAGKHILCEKPFAPSSKEAKAMLDACQKAGVQVHEAFMWRFHPRTMKIVELVRSGKIGRLRLLRGSFSYLIGTEANIRLEPHLAGGALMDVGCYCVNFSRLITQAEPLSAFATMSFLNDKPQDPFSIDVATTAILEFPERVVSTFSSRFDTGFDGQWMEIVGTSGIIRVDFPFNPQPGKNSVRLNDQNIPCETADHFRLELDNFSLSLLERGRPVHPLVQHSDPYYQAKVIEGLYQAAKSGQKVALT